MPGAVRIPVRPLTIDQQDLYAYPGEILIDPATGLIKYIVDDSTFVFNKNPGKLTVKYGTTTLIDEGDLSTTLSFTIPVVTWNDIAPDSIAASLINGLTANRALISSASGVLTASSVTNTELEYLSGVTSSIQNQLNDKAATNHNHSGVYLPINGTAAAATKLATARTITIGSSTAKSFDGTDNLSYTLSEIGAASADHNHDGVYLPVGGTAAAATKLATARAITIGSASKNFDGSAPISFTLSEIGAAAVDHTHTGYIGASGGTITGTLTISGTLSVTGNATGIQKVYTGTLSTSWSGSAAPYTQTVTVSGILSTDRPTVDFTCSGTYATDQSREEGWLNVYRAVTAANSITFYAHDKPTVSIPFVATVVR